MTSYTELVVVAETAAESEAKAAQLRSLIPYYRAVGYGPKPEEPPPPPVPFPPYEPKVWAACRTRGQDPARLSGRFYHAPLSAGFRSLPAGDSVLYCGIPDKYGMLHIEKDHFRDWDKVATQRWPSAGNWRYLADYAIGAALAYPERVEYNPDNDTLAVYRKIYRQDGAYVCTFRVAFRQVTGRSSRPSRKRRDERLGRKEVVA